MDAAADWQQQHNNKHRSCCRFNHHHHSHINHHHNKQKQLERFSFMARIAAIVTNYKLMLLCVFVLNCSVAAKFAVYFHRKEFRRKKPFAQFVSPVLL